MTRVLIYGDVDLNLIDGSAVWLASLAQVLGGMPDVAATVLQKTPVTRDLVIRSAAALPNVRFLDPWLSARWRPEDEDALVAMHWKTPFAGGRGHAGGAAHGVSLFDVVLVRSLEAAAVLAGLPALGRGSGFM